MALCLACRANGTVRGYRDNEELLIDSYIFSCLISSRITSNNHSTNPQPLKTLQPRRSSSTRQASGYLATLQPPNTTATATMYSRGDGRDYMRESRERRARESSRPSGEYSSSSYANTDAYTRGPPPSSSSYSYETGYAGYRIRTPYDRYDVPPSPRGRRPSFDYAAYDFDGSSADTTDPLRERFDRTRKPASYARPAASPPPTRRAAYDPDEGSAQGPRWVATMSIKEADDNDPQLKNMPKAPYVYVGTEDPDGTVVDKPKKATRTPRESARTGGASSSYGSSRDSARYPSSGGYSAGAYATSGTSGTSYAAYSASYSSYSGPSYGGSSYTGGSSYGSSGRSSSHGRNPYGPFY